MMTGPSEMTTWFRHQLSPHRSGRRLIVIWNDLLSFWRWITWPHDVQCLSHNGLFLHSDVFRPLVLDAFHNKYWIRWSTLSSFLDLRFGEFPLNLHEGPPCAFHSDKVLYQAAVWQALFFLSKHSLHIVIHSYWKHHFICTCMFPSSH